MFQHFCLFFQQNKIIHIIHDTSKNLYTENVN